jgi:hypothetical protein
MFAPTPARYCAKLWLPFVGVLNAIGRYTEGDCQQCLRLRVDAITFVGRRCGGTAQSISYVRSQLCEMCLKDGRINAATIADHIERHRVISKNSSSASFSRFV